MHGLSLVLFAGVVGLGLSGLPDLEVRGRHFVDRAANQLYVPRWVSGLTLLVRTPAQQDAFLAWAESTGFNGVRVFAGALTWADQTPEGARAQLPALLERAAARGLAVEVTAITDSATGYDARDHLRRIVDIVAGRRGVVLELANEVGHHTQDPAITMDVLREWGMALAEPKGVVWAVGASLETDQPVRDVYPGHGGRYSTVHLDRGPPLWEQSRRVRVIYAVVEAHGRPAINNEPSGCAEPGTKGQRYFEPVMAFTLGTLERAFAIGGVHHSQAGLMAEVPGPVQQRCAEHYVAGHRAVEQVMGATAGRYVNVGHSGSPVAAARLVDGGAAPGVVRAYSFVDGTRGVTVLVGVKGDAGLQWANGWSARRVVAERVAADGRATRVIEIVRR